MVEDPNKMYTPIESDKTQEDNSVDTSVEQAETVKSAADEEKSILGNATSESEDKSTEDEEVEGEEDTEEEKDDDSEEEDKSEDDSKSEEVPEKYEFNVPEGMELDTGLIDKMTPVLKELGITQKKAQKLVDIYAPHIQEKINESKESLAKEYAGIIDTWKEDTKKYLGKDADKKLAPAAKFLDKFGSKELRQILTDTGFGNHVELVKAFVKAGKAISEDSFVESGAKRKGRIGIDPYVLYHTHKK